MTKVSSTVQPPKVQDLPVRPPIKVGNRITPGGHDSFSLALWLWYATLIDVTSQSVKTLDLWSMFQRFRSLTPLQMLTALDKLCDAHLDVIARKCEPSFIRDVLRRLPPEIQGFVTLIEGAIGNLSTREVTSVRSWRQILSFLLRSDYGFLEGGEFVQEWESRNRDIGIDIPFDLGESFRRFSDHSFESVCRRNFVPHHGPGASAYRDQHGAIRTGRLSINEKDRLLRYHPYVDHRFAEWMPKVGGLGEVVPNVLLDVPKSWKKRRLIAVESADRMWLQEGMKEGLYKALMTDTFFSSHIDFKHADRAWPLTLEGSRTGRFATIDLSAASDSVRIGAVCRIFDTCPYILDGLLSFRADSVLSGDRIIPMRMFASMGNATTFPVETTLFACACIEAIRRSSGDVHASQFRVYGDDIIIETKYAECLVSVLAECGFEVNSQKSYIASNCNFRESCGLEAYQGYDITPFRLPRGFASVEFGTATLFAISSWVSIANEMFFHGLTTGASWIRRAILSQGRRAVPISSGELGFYSPCPNNRHLPAAWSSYSEDPSVNSFQRLLHIYPSYTLGMCERENGALAFYEWLGRAQLEDPDALVDLPRSYRRAAEVGILSVSERPRETSRVASGALHQTISWF